MITNGDSILILASGNTGNNLFMTPSIRLIREKNPDSLIEIVVLNRLSREVFYSNPYINKVKVINRSSDFDDYAKKFDHVVTLHPNSITKNYKSIKTDIYPLPLIVKDYHLVDQLLNYVANILNAEVDLSYRKIFFGSLLNGNKKSDKNIKDELTINVHLGCAKININGWKFWSSKRAQVAKVWDVKCYISLCEKLLERYPKLKITISGSKNELFLANQFTKKIPSAINLVGKTQLHQLVKHISSCDLYISHDCGILHAASTTSTPIVALFGPSSQIKTGPYPNNRSNTVIIKRDTMSEILVSEVFQAAIVLIDKLKVDKRFN